MSQEECARLREGVLYVKIYRYNYDIHYENAYGSGCAAVFSSIPYYISETACLLFCAEEIVM
jgi:hypothetical protein